jgi:hypothetical protein
MYSSSSADIHNKYYFFGALVNKKTFIQYTRTMKYYEVKSRHKEKERREKDKSC